MFTWYHFEAWVLEWRNLADGWMSSKDHKDIALGEIRLKGFYKQNSCRAFSDLLHVC